MKTRPKIHWPAASFIVSFGGYDFDVLIAVNMSLADARDKLDSMGVALTASDRECFDAKSSTKGRTVVLDGGPLVIWLSEWSADPKSHGRLAHEVFHATVGLMDRIGVRFGDKSEEAYAHAIEDLTRTILAEFSKPPSKRRREP